MKKLVAAGMTAIAALVLSVGIAAPSASARGKYVHICLTVGPDGSIVPTTCIDI
jgi:hypothetical protein